jgi:hypothetical protein
MEHHEQPLLPICVVHVRDDGPPEFLLTGDVRFLIVDECAPDDRVYEITLQRPREEIMTLVGDSTIGSCQDARQAAAAQRIMRWFEGRNHIAAVIKEDPAAG